MNFDLTEETRIRQARLIRANEDPVYRDFVMEACKRDPVLWINDWCWTFDPRNAARGLPTMVPFKLFTRQVEYIQWRRERLAKREFGNVPKARDSGISYLNCADHAHHFLFDYGYVGGLASRKELLVDRLGDPGSLFQKIRSILQYLPSWMKPDPKNMFDGYMKLLNHEKGNAITGEAGLQIGRGNRYLLLDIDEFAFLENQDTVMAAVSQSADCVIKTSTPNGSANLFAQECNSGENSTFFFRWTSDDRKNHWVVPATGETGNGETAPLGAVYPWYEDQKKKLSALTVAQEIDIDFNASVEGVVIPHAHVLAAVNYPLVMHNFTRTAGLDIATTGKDRSVLIILDAGVKVIEIVSWQGQSTTQTAHRAIELCHKHNVDHLFFDSIGVGQGVAGTLQATPGLRFQFHPVNVGTSPTDFYWVAEQRSSKDKFYNLRAELYHRLALKFFYTWENVHGIAVHSTDDCISIPNHPTLIAQLPTITAKFTENGKVLLNPKKDLKVSPDFADSLMLATHPIPNPGWATVKATW